MKKLLALMLAAVLALSLVACGGGGEAGDNNTPGGGDSTPTKEELLESATNVTIGTIGKEIRDNKLKAEQTYVGNSFIIGGFVRRVESDHCILSMQNDAGDFGTTIRAYLPTDSLVELKRGEWINIVGVIDSLEAELLNTSFDIIAPAEYITMKTAYFIDNIRIMTGKVEIFHRNSYGRRYAFQMNDTLISLEDSQLSLLQEGDKVTVTGPSSFNNSGVLGAPSYIMDNPKLEILEK